MVWFWDHYAPDPEARLHPDASPLRSANFAGLPPAVILTAEHDVLRDEGELYATRLVKAGVPVRHRRFAGQMHGFFTMVDAAARGGGGPGLRGGGHRRAAESRRPGKRTRTSTDRAALNGHRPPRAAVAVWRRLRDRLGSSSTR